MYVPKARKDDLDNYRRDHHGDAPDFSAIFHYVDWQYILQMTFWTDNMTV